MSALLSMKTISGKGASVRILTLSEAGNRILVFAVISPRFCLEIRQSHYIQKLILRNQKCRVLDDRGISFEFVKNANLTAKNFRHKVPVEISSKADAVRKTHREL